MNPVALGDFVKKWQPKVGLAFSAYFTVIYTSNDIFFLSKKRYFF